MGLLARMANGISDDLITRSADVILKGKKEIGSRSQGNAI
jgi:3-polyprenyl-4-hydroxybenzoate decarboxylase